MLNIICALLLAISFPNARIEGFDFVFEAEARTDLTQISYCTYETELTNGSDDFIIRASISQQSGMMLVLVSGLPENLSESVHDLDARLPHARIQRFATRDTMLSAEIEPSDWPAAKLQLVSSDWAVRGVRLKNGDLLRLAALRSSTAPKNEVKARAACLEAEFAKAHECREESERLLAERSPTLLNSSMHEMARAVEAAGLPVCNY
ncbi:MAG: hypothetical protein JWL84_15 [Rhodospirillales bacterium]|nr:hypothetical protein [Rhodospirillales bacterium]